MGLYNAHVLPWLIDRVMRAEELGRFRARLIPSARGRVLEVGVGSGLNLPHYGSEARVIVGVDPSAKLVELSRKRSVGHRVPVEILQADVMKLPFATASFDTVVSTWVMCSVPDLARGLAEIRRVLAPGGQLVFVEHGISPRPLVRTVQRGLTPIWKHVSGGCHLDRDMRTEVGAAGFDVTRLETEHGGPFSEMYFGVARPT